MSMKYTFKNISSVIIAFMLSVLIFGEQAFSIEKPDQQIEEEKGPNGGKIFSNNGVKLELVLYELGLPPEYRIWVTEKGNQIVLEEAKVQMTLTRIGGVVDKINFRQHGDFLRGDLTIYEPHSFIVMIILKYKGDEYKWEYENFEGRTIIPAKISRAMNIGTREIGPANITERLKVYGNLTFRPQDQINIRSRFPGLIKRSYKSIGNKVKKGELLFTIENSISLKDFEVLSPIDGYVEDVHCKEGEVVNEQILMKVINNSTIQANLKVFPKDNAKVKSGMPVTVKVNDKLYKSTINNRSFDTSENQAIIHRAYLDNSLGELAQGQRFTANIEISSTQVPLAVEVDAIQAFRDFKVVYALFEETYEVRMLELGRRDSQWVEVLDGIKPGTRYVNENSYIIKADIEKSGASHDH